MTIPSTVCSNISAIFSSKQYADSEVIAHTELKRLLISIGFNTELTNALTQWVLLKGLGDPERLPIHAVIDVLVERLDKIIPKNNVKVFDNQPIVICMFGVNGQGKTSTAAKLGNFIIKHDLCSSVTLAAGDTFRAGAFEQLLAWSNVLGCQFYGNKKYKDPASLIFDAIANTASCNESNPALIIDTSGRQENNVPLIKELSKCVQVLHKAVDQKMPPNTKVLKLMVVDINVGNISIEQAKIFNQSVQLDGLVITKLDYKYEQAAKAITIAYNLSVPIYFLTFGETKDDVSVFNRHDFVRSLFGINKT